MQKLQSGWGLYSHNSLQEAILLPEGIRLKWEFCTSPEVSSCNQRPMIPATVRSLVASKASSASAVSEMQYEVSYPNENLTMRVEYRFDGDDNMELTFHSTSTPKNGFLRISADVAYFPARRGSSLRRSPSSITVSASGLRSFSFSTCNSDQPCAVLPVGFEQSSSILVSVPKLGQSMP